MLSGKETVNLTTTPVVSDDASVFTAIKKELEKFGLTENQAKIYVLLVQRKELRIQEIVTLTQIPRSSVYESLRGLYELGIAEEIVEDNFKKIRPYSIGAMRHGLDEKMLHLKRLTGDLHNLERTIDSMPAHASDDSTRVRYYKNRAGARQLYWNTLKTHDTVRVYSDWGRGRYVGMKFYERFVAESRERGVKEKVLINLSPHALESIRKYTYPDSPISRTKIEDIRVISAENITIKGDTLLYDNTYAQIYLKGLKINGFEIESGHFADTQRSIFETFWKMAEPVTKFL